MKKKKKRKETFGVSHATGSKVLKDDDEGAQKKTKRNEFEGKLAKEGRDRNNINNNLEKGDN